MNKSLFHYLNTVFRKSKEKSSLYFIIDYSYGLELPRGSAL